MKNLFNQSIIKILPYLPLFLVRSIAAKYVAGETSHEALQIVSALNKKGFSVTLGVGIFTTLFSVYFIARLLTSLYLMKNKNKENLI